MTFVDYVEQLKLKKRAIFQSRSSSTVIRIKINLLANFTTIYYQIVGIRIFTVVAIFS